MGRPAVNVLYVLAMVAVVVGVDVLFFRHHAWNWLGVRGVLLQVSEASMSAPIAMLLTRLRGAGG
jgi:hypothetical protein